jgi:hypothetical protein
MAAVEMLMPDFDRAGGRGEGGSLLGQPALVLLKADKGGK